MLLTAQKLITEVIVTGGGSWGTERESGKEENGNWWNHFQKHKEMNLFMQAIETE